MLRLCSSVSELFFFISGMLKIFTWFLNGVLVAISPASFAVAGFYLRVWLGASCSRLVGDSHFKQYCWSFMWMFLMTDLFESNQHEAGFYIPVLGSLEMKSNSKTFSAVHTCLWNKIAFIFYPELLHLSTKTACALQFLHERNISHLDLKPQNILLSGSILKLAGDHMHSLNNKLMFYCKHANW